MPHFSETIEISRPPEAVWQALARPERWFEGYLETKNRSPDYPAPDSRNDHVYKTRMKENVSVKVTRSEAESLLEETQDGKTFSRRVVYRLEPGYEGTKLTVEDDIDFKGLGKLAGPLAARDVKSRWARSLENLRNAAKASG
jgi:carbon monoxide dehydrogenase subunit G